jgi:hypothetical protein
MAAWVVREEFPDEELLQPALKRPEKKIDPGDTGDEEDDLGERHTVASRTSYEPITRWGRQYFSRNACFEPDTKSPRTH